MLYMFREFSTDYKNEHYLRFIIFIYISFKSQLNNEKIQPQVQKIWL